jgi:uncharacterized protein (UPF0276 family)
MWSTSKGCSMRHPSSDSELPVLGVGLSYSSAVEPLLEQFPELVDIVEVEPQTTWFKTRNESSPYRIPEGVLEHLARLPGRKLIHSVGAPVGGTVRPDPAQFALLRRCVESLDAPWVSEHLSFNTTPEFHTGFFLPPRQTPEGVDAVARSICVLKQSLPVPLAVETGVNYLQPRADEMPDGAFIAGVVEAADCGLLLDLHNIYANALNGRQSVEDFLSQIPRDRIWEIHLAGGFEMEGYWLDAHSGAIPEPLLEIARRVIPELSNLKAIIFEIFPSFVPVVGLDIVREQIERMRELWGLRGAAAARDHEQPVDPKDHQAPAHSKDCASPAAWERTLGMLVIGHSPDDGGDELARDLAKDSGVRVVNRLIGEFRASMIVGALRLTARLMMLAIGPDLLRAILEDFWSKTPPQQFASLEAEAFADYLVALDLKIPQLAKVLEFERATMATLIDEQPRVVAFDIDPLPMLRALAEGHLLDIPGQPGSYEIEITADGTTGLIGSDMEPVQSLFPFH